MVKWAKKNENGWVRGTLESEKVYEGKSMFSLPKRQGLLNLSVCLLKTFFPKKRCIQSNKTSFFTSGNNESRDLPGIDFNYYFT